VVAFYEHFAVKGRKALSFLTLVNKILADNGAGNIKDCGILYWYLVL
jgi:hypothetical protein